LFGRMGTNSKDLFPFVFLVEPPGWAALRYYGQILNYFIISL